MAAGIAWNFRYMYEGEGPFSCSFEKLATYVKRLKDYEGRSRAEVESHKNSNHGWRDTKSLSREFKKAVATQPVLLDKRLSQLELDGKCRAFGFYEDNIFHFVFLDERHDAYPIAKN